jgi:hypothetical protein
VFSLARHGFIVVVQAAVLSTAAAGALAQGAQWVDPPPAPAQSAPSPAAPQVKPPAAVETARPAPSATVPKAAPAERQRAVAAPDPEPPPKRRLAKPPPMRETRAPTPPRLAAPAVARPAPREIDEVAPRRRLARPAASVVARPSFNCGYARTAVERAICADPALAAKDRRMALLYEQAGGSRFRPVDPTQWGWLAARNRCARTSGAALEACVHRAYDARIAELAGF